MTLTIPEFLTYMILNNFPYMLLAVYPFRKQLRFPWPITVLILLILGFLQTGLMYLVILFPVSWIREVMRIVGGIFNVVFAMLLIRARLGRLAYSSIMVINCSNFVAVAAKCLEFLLFPAHVNEIYSYTVSICMFIIQNLIFFPLFKFVDRFFNFKVRNAIDTRMWNWLWIVPESFYIIWIYVFYHNPYASFVELSIQPPNTVFSLILILVQLFISACMASFVQLFQEKRLKEEAEHQLSLQALQYKTIQEQIHETRVLRHDFRQHLLTLSGYARNDDYENLKAYLNDYISEMPSFNTLSYCTNTSLNMLLVYYSQLCSSRHIDFQVSVQLPEALPLSDKEISIVFGNLLENAFQACESQETLNPKMSFTARKKNSQYLFLLENSYTNRILRTQDDSFKTTKEGGSGLGILSAKSIVQKHDGYFNVTPATGVFQVSIQLSEK